jgi:hypothetical protein
MKYKSYSIVKVGKIPQAKLKKALNGGTINLTANELKGDQCMCVHPANAAKIVAAQKANKGVRLGFTHGEANHDIEYHGDKQGGSVWSWLKEKAWPVIKTVLSGVGDAIAYSNPTLAPLREGVRGLTGIGFKKVIKGSQEAKDKMAALRAKRGKKGTSGGSFKL